MGIKDLELEFETEEEVTKTNSDAIEVDIDLDFSANVEERPKRIPKPKPIPASLDPNPNPIAAENVRSLEEARSHSSSISAKVTKDVDVLKSEIAKLKAEILNVKKDSDVRVAVAEAEKDFLVEHVSNAKLLDHQVTQLLRSIHKKAPGTAAEVQSIKKLLVEFLNKSR